MIETEYQPLHEYGAPYHTMESVEELHVEITSRCNAACPMCARNDHGGATKPNLQLTDWTMDDARRVFDPGLRNLKNVLFCGTHGDPASSPIALDIVQLAKSLGNITVEFYSNASLRNREWWRQLGEILNYRRSDHFYRKSDVGVFSIDGLSDTNHIYRRRTNFEKIVENAEAFIRAGGIARWDFLVFKHNEHQVEEAEKMAKKLGFSQFRIRKTSRFAHSPDGTEKYRVNKKDGNLDYFIEPPASSEMKNSNFFQFAKDVKDAKQENYQFKDRIKCLNKTSFQRLYVNSLMDAHPCCFMSDININGSGRAFEDYSKKVLEKYGHSFNSLRKHSWHTILSHDWFSSQLTQSWKSPESCLLRCSVTCSEKYSPITSQSLDAMK